MYILLDVLVCSIAEFFWVMPYKQRVNLLSDTTYQNV